jgi:hypothetical protein
MRSPLTGVIFALELTHRYEALLPLLIGATAAYTISILILRRSVLTEKIARRGIHLSREYSVDPLEVLFVGDVMGDARPVGSTNGAGANGVIAAGSDDAPIVFADDTLRHVAYVMAASKRTELPVAERSLPEVPIGTVRLDQLLEGRLRDLDEERHRTRVLRPLELLRPGREPAAAGKR